MNNEQEEKRKLWKIYGILMGVMVGGAVLILGTQAAWNAIQRHSAKSTEAETSAEPETPSNSSTLPNPPVSSQYNSQPTQPTIPSGLSQQEAVNLINQWLQAKGKIFAPPFDRQLLAQYTHTQGKLYQDIVKLQGPMDWLRSTGSYYTFNQSQIIEVIEFSTSGELPVLKVKISENMVFYNGEQNKRETKASTNSYTYTFRQQQGSWKIEDYQ
ncbi:ARC6/PARC6 family protein [Planktothricoides raciborskii]|uniref:ARC6/PARC6 family protein n=1 Tax=Planktothricoides raciborskii GIHE-MW2 TaxID=2792601 RepID=A0AAU8JJY8_9CYAN